LNISSLLFVAFALQQTTDTHRRTQSALMLVPYEKLNFHLPLAQPARWGNHLKTVQVFISFAGFAEVKSSNVAGNMLVGKGLRWNWAWVEISVGYQTSLGEFEVGSSIPNVFEWVWGGGCFKKTTLSEGKVLLNIICCWKWKYIDLLHYYNCYI